MHEIDGGSRGQRAAFLAFDAPEHNQLRGRAFADETIKIAVLLRIRQAEAFDHLALSAVAVRVFGLAFELVQSGTQRIEFLRGNLAHAANRHARAGLLGAATAVFKEHAVLVLNGAWQKACQRSRAHRELKLMAPKVPATVPGADGRETAQFQAKALVWFECDGHGVCGFKNDE
ncbi:MAG TPA: hypothetical protein DDZ88_19590 [Verrucomicrobiales bacterium]|nr:hypothetical protein [Verrucomicrobiales bacterium]